VSLQRRCANNLNQVAIHANTCGVYPSEIKGLQKDYAELWGRVSDVLEQLTAIVELWGTGNGCKPFPHVLFMIELLAAQAEPPHNEE
jgi:hypothetical protein